MGPFVGLWTDPTIHLYSSPSTYIRTAYLSGRSFKVNFSRMKKVRIGSERVKGVCQYDARKISDLLTPPCYCNTHTICMCSRQLLGYHPPPLPVQTSYVHVPQGCLLSNSINEYSILKRSSLLHFGINLSVPETQLILNKSSEGFFRHLQLHLNLTSQVLLDM